MADTSIGGHDRMHHQKQGWLRQVGKRILAMEGDVPFRASGETSMSFPPLEKGNIWGDEFSPQFEEDLEESPADMLSGEASRKTSELDLSAWPKGYGNPDCVWVRPNGEEVPARKRSHDDISDTFVIEVRWTFNNPATLAVPADQIKPLPKLSSRKTALGTPVARWESTSGKHYVDLLADEDGDFSYAGPGMGGMLTPGLTFEEAVAEMENRVVPLVQPDANKTPMNRVALANPRRRVKGGVTMVTVRLPHKTLWSISNIGNDVFEGEAATEEEAEEQIREALKRMARKAYKNVYQYTAHKEWSRKAALAYPGVFSVAAKEDHVREIMSEYDMTYDEASDEAQYQYETDPAVAEQYNVNADTVIEGL